MNSNTENLTSGTRKKGPWGCVGIHNSIDKYWQFAQSIPVTACPVEIPQAPFAQDNHDHGPPSWFEDVSVQPRFPAWLLLASKLSRDQVCHARPVHWLPSSLDSGNQREHLYSLAMKGPHKETQQPWYPGKEVSSKSRSCNRSLGNQASTATCLRTSAVKARYCCGEPGEMPISVCSTQKPRKWCCNYQTFAACLPGLFLLAACSAKMCQGRSKKWILQTSSNIFRHLKSSIDMISRHL